MPNNKTHGDLGLLQTRLFETPLLFERGRLTTIVNVVTAVEGIPIREEISQHPDESDRPRRMQAIHEGVFVIDIVGSLVKSTSGMIWDSGLTSYQSISEDLDFALEESSVLGVLLRIDSPGGEVHGAFELAKKIREFPKPIHASVDDIALSGGYALASSARRITVTNTGAVGSIGVLMVVRDETERDKAIGVKYHFVSAGKGKGALNPHKEITENDIKPFRVELNRVYGIFVDSVSRGRGSKISVEKIEEFGAHLAFGPMGIDLGLSDAVGSFDDSLEFLQKEVGDLSTNSLAGNSVGLSMPVGVKGLEFVFADGEGGGQDTAAAASHPEGGDQGEDKNSQETESSQGGKEEMSNKNQEGQEGNEGNKDTTALNEAVAAAVANNLEIVQICDLAGYPAMAAGFLEKGVSVSDARVRLMEMKASDGDDTSISSNRGERHKDQSGGDQNVVVAACENIAAGMRRQMNYGREVG